VLRVEHFQFRIDVWRAQRVPNEHDQGARLQEDFSLVLRPRSQTFRGQKLKMANFKTLQEKML
jgi:hypothetical protein